jgi:hypothetical protein
MSNDKKTEYNFVNKKNIIESVESNDYRSVTKEKEEIIQPVKNTEIREKIKENEIISNVNNNNENILKELKKDNILQNTRNTSNNDFTITPKFTYSYTTIDGYYPGKVGLLDKKNVLIPEISLAFKNHTLRAEGMNTKAYFKGVIIGNEDLDTKSSWYKLHYLYKYKNVNFGLAYNDYKTSWDFINSNMYYHFEANERFPSLEIHLKNEENRIQTEYGLSYGKNSNIDYAYEYYLTLGYKTFKNNGLIFSVGYKNKTIDIESLKFEYKGPTVGISGTF